MVFKILREMSRNGAGIGMRISIPGILSLKTIRAQHQALTVFYAAAAGAMARGTAL